MDENNKDSQVFSRCSAFDTEDFRKTRREITFPVFVNKTDEKNQTIKVLSTFLDNYLPGLINNISCSVVDLGVGSGDLSYKVANYIHGKCDNVNVSYYGIDKIESFVNLTRSKLSTLGFVNDTIIHGSCFSDDIDRLAKNPVLLIASQVVFYLNQTYFNSFIERVVQKMGLVAIVIAQANGSFLNKIGSIYDNSTKQVETEKRVEDAFQKHNLTLNHIKILYSTVIHFLPTITYNQLMEIALADFNRLPSNSLEFQTRALLEFVAGTPLERLTCLDPSLLSNFIGDIYTHLTLNGGNIRFWNYMSITVPKDNMNQEAMQNEWRKIQNFTLSGDLKSFDAAIQEGNYEIALAISRQGLMTCELNYYTTHLGREILDKITSFMWYGISLSEEKELLKLMHIETDARAKHRNYISYELLKMQEIKYNYTVLTPERTSFTSNSESFRIWVSKTDMTLALLAPYPLLHEFVWSITLIIPFIIISDPITQSQLACSMLMMLSSFWKKHFDASSSALHFIKGDDFLLQLYLYNKKHYHTLTFQDNEGQTALHKAIINEDNEKTLKLLSCSNPVVEKIVNIVDIKGRYPLHYAVIMNNRKIVEFLLAKKIDINTQTEISTLSLLVDIIFITGKILYLSAYFTNCINHNAQNHIYKYPALIAIYAIARNHEIQFPNHLYYLSFLHRLDAFAEWKHSLDYNQAYHGYSKDTPLHLSCAHNHTDLTKYLVTKNADINLSNAKGETALHLAAANNNIELVSFLINHKADINIKAKHLDLYPILDFLLKAATIYFSANTLLKSVSEIIFLKVINDEIFSSFYAANLATPLHYAVAGMSLSECTLKSCKTENTNNGNESIICLIENGTDPDLTMNFYNDVNIQIIPYITTKAIMMLAELPVIYSLPILAISQYFFPYYAQKLKPIDLAQDESLYQYLKQYTILNQYTATSDVIEMQQYGMYKGGAGKDIFNIYCDYIGKKDGYKLIIKDYEIREDHLQLQHCDSSNQVKYKSSIIANEIATILYFAKNKGDELVVVLLGISIEQFDEISLF